MLHTSVAATEHHPSPSSTGVRNADARLTGQIAEFVRLRSTAQAMGTVVRFLDALARTAEGIGGQNTFLEQVADVKDAFDLEVLEGGDVVPRYEKFCARLRQLPGSLSLPGGGREP
jgi:hypothetical protein